MASTTTIQWWDISKICWQVLQLLAILLLLLIIHFPTVTGASWVPGSTLGAGDTAPPPPTSTAYTGLGEREDKKESKRSARGLSWWQRATEKQRHNMEIHAVFRKGLLPDTATCADTPEGGGWGGDKEDTHKPGRGTADTELWSRSRSALLKGPAWLEGEGRRGGQAQAEMEASGYWEWQVTAVSGLGLMSQFWFREQCMKLSLSKCDAGIFVQDIL